MQSLRIRSRQNMLSMEGLLVRSDRRAECSMGLQRDAPGARPVMGAPGVNPPPFNYTGISIMHMPFQSCPPSCKRRSLGYAPPITMANTMENRFCTKQCLNNSAPSPRPAKRSAFNYALTNLFRGVLVLRGISLNGRLSGGIQFRETSGMAIKLSHSPRQERQ